SVRRGRIRLGKIAAVGMGGDPAVTALIDARGKLIKAQIGEKLRSGMAAPQGSRRKWDREILWGGRRGDGNFLAECNRWSAAMPQPNDLSRSLVALDQNSTIIAVVELSQSSWLVAGVLPGVERQPCKKLEPNPEGLLV